MPTIGPCAVLHATSHDAPCVMIELGERIYGHAGRVLAVMTTDR